MSKENKDEQLHIRLTKKEKERLKKFSSNYGYKNISKFIMDSLIYERKNKKNHKNKVFTITLSPTLDYFINLDNIEFNEIKEFNKKDIYFDAGGRGINTSKVLNEFNVDNVSIYIAGGFTGDKIQQVLDKQDVEQFKINNNIETRININLVDSKKSKSLEEKPSKISTLAKETLIDFVDQHISENDKVVLSGSYIDQDLKFVKDLSKKIKSKCKNIYLNTSSNDVLELANILKPKFIILDEKNDENLKTKKQIKKYVDQFIELGIKEIAFFIDANYTYYFNDNKTYLLETLIDKEKSKVACSDSFIGAIIANEGKEIKQKIRWASAAQKAKSLTQSSVEFSKIVDLLDEVNIIEE